MIALQQPLQLDQCDGDSLLILWLCDPFDEHYSFRVALSEIEHALSMLGPVSYTLPPEEPMEDFVFGKFAWDGREFSLYFERSLGYMQFSSPSSVDVQTLQSALLPVAQTQKA